MTRSVLVATYTNWTSPFQVGAQHLARCFAAAGWRVGYVSDPLSPWSALVGLTSELRARYDVYRRGGVADVRGRLWAYVPGALLPPHREPVLRSMKVHRNWYRFTMPSLVDKLRAKRFDRVDVLYCDNPIYAFCMTRIAHGRSILRISDRRDGFSRTTRAQVLLERELARRVDLVVYSASTLKDHVARMRPRRMMYLPNGLDFEHFAEGSRRCPPEFESIRPPIVLYVGALSEWFDFDTVNTLAERLPEVSFVLIGPKRMARSRIRRRRNVHVLGARPYPELPGYMHNADVGIIPFNIRDLPTLVDSVNPIKLYEYMASGLPVVATKWEALERLQSPARLCSSVDDFVEGIRCSLEIPLDAEALRSYAQSRDWQKQFRKLVAALSLD